MITVEVEQEGVHKWVAWVVAPTHKDVHRISFTDVSPLGAAAAARAFVERYTYLTHVLTPPAPVPT
jgi:hypothetical protein